MGSTDIPLEQRGNWPEGVRVYTHCITCKELMDNPHCTNGGCPWCIQCGTKSEK